MSDEFWSDPFADALIERGGDLRPVTFDSVGSPIYAHQLPPEEPSDER